MSLSGSIARQPYYDPLDGTSIGYGFNTALRARAYAAAATPTGGCGSSDANGFVCCTGNPLVKKYTSSRTACCLSDPFSSPTSCGGLARDPGSGSFFSKLTQHPLFLVGGIALLVIVIVLIAKR